MPNSSRLLLMIPIVALAPALASSAEPTAAAAAPAQASTPAPNQLPDWAPKPKPSVIEDRLRLEINLLGASATTKLRVDESPTAPGTEINVEDDLGLDDYQLLPQVELTLLPGERHLIRLSRFAIDRSAATRLEKNISFDDQDYLIGERVDTIIYQPSRAEVRRLAVNTECAF